VKATSTRKRLTIRGDEAVEWDSKRAEMRIRAKSVVRGKQRSDRLENDNARAPGRVVMWHSKQRRCGRMGLEFSTNEDSSELESVELDVNQWPEQPLHLYSY